MAEILQKNLSYLIHDVNSSHYNNTNNIVYQQGVINHVLNINLTQDQFDKLKDIIE